MVSGRESQGGPANVSTPKGRRKPAGRGSLPEIGHAARKEALILFSRDIFVQIGPLPFAVAHLAENPAIGRGDAFHPADRTVGVPQDIAGRHSLRRDVLGGDLAVFGQAADRLLVREEAALSMGDRDSVDRPGLTAGPAMGI